MKVYALKYKNDIINFYKTEYEVVSHHRWEDKALVKDLTVVYGTFTEEGVIEYQKEGVSV